MRIQHKEIFCPRGWQITAYKLEIVLTFLDDWKKIKRAIIFCVTLKWYEIQILLFINKVFLEHSHAYSYSILYSYFTPLWQSGVIAIENTWLRKPEIGVGMIHAGCEGVSSHWGQRCLWWVTWEVRTQTTWCVRFHWTHFPGSSQKKEKGKI